MKRITALIVCLLTVFSLASCDLLSSLGLFDPFETKGYVRCDKDGTRNKNGDYLLFGEYPQSLKAEDVTVTAESNELGYFLGSDGEYYAKVVSTPYAEDYTFANGSAVTGGETYYFKVEPIRWRILSEGEEHTLILCDSIIDSSAFSTAKSNNYEYSTVRDWLGGQFYDTAFSELQRELIAYDEVDNGSVTTGVSPNPYFCNNTYDTVFLLSYAEASSPDYGFSSDATAYDESRRLLTSDYARATGVLMKTDPDYYGNGTWWLRSPRANKSSSAWRMDTKGGADNGVTSSAQYGVAPALRIKLK